MIASAVIDIYRYEITDDYRIIIYRHGEQWRDETGDNAMMLLIQELSDIQNFKE